MADTALTPTPDTSAPPAGTSRFVGWLADPGPPFAGPLLVRYEGRSLIVIGPNGYGKTRLLRALTDRRTPRLFASLPKRVTPYLTMERNRLEGSRPPAAALTDRALFELAEATRAHPDDADWWRRRLGVPDLWWSVRPPTGPDDTALICAVTPDDPLTELVRIPASGRHLHYIVERWVIPAAADPDALREATRESFRAWATSVFAAGPTRVRMFANPLVAGRTDGTSVSLLPFATAFAAVLAARTAARLRVLAGFALALRCRPEEDFAWQVEVDGDWIPLSGMSQAISRWSVLAATETMREVVEYAADASVVGVRTDTDQLLDGDLGRSMLPPGDPSAFATRSTWVAMDEPEIHLFASEAHVLGDTLAAQGRSGRSIFVTHSLDFAARFVGIADFLMFDGPGRFSVDRPRDGVDSLLGRLARFGPGILASTKVLYVEGDWDVEMLERLHGPELSAANVLLSRTHGVKGAGLAASSVWQRMTATPFGIMFDHLRSASLEARWTALRDSVARRGRAAVLGQLRAGIRSARGARIEEVEILRLFHAVIEGRLEDRLHLVMHGLSDILQVVHPSVFGLDAADWSAAGYTGAESFKAFCRRRTGVDLTDGSQCRRIVDAFDRAGRPVDAPAAAALAAAVRAFAGSGRPS